MNTQVRNRTSDRSARKYVAPPSRLDSVVDDPQHDADIVRMATAEVSARNAERRAMIANAAYYRAQKRGFEPGHEIEDWLAAETEIAAVFASGLAR